MNRREFFALVAGAVIHGQVPPSAAVKRIDWAEVIADRLFSRAPPLPDAWKVIDAIATDYDRHVGLTDLLYGENFSK